MDTNKPEAAIVIFGRVARIDPEDADTRYFLGQAESAASQHIRQAIAAFESALSIDPFHVSAAFASAQAYMRSGDQAKVREHLARFQHLTAAKLGEPMTLVYGEQGKYSQVESIAPGGIESVPPAIPVRFVNVTKDSGLPTTARPSPAGPTSTAAGYLGSGACVFDYDGDGKPDIFC